MKTTTGEPIPQVLRYKGDYIVLVRQVHDFGPEAVVFFDLDGDGSFEQQVCADGTGVFVFCLEAGLLKPGGKFSVYIRSADSKKQSKIVEVSTIRESPYNPASKVPVNKVPADGFNPEPEICICTDCPPDDTLIGSSLDGYTHSYTPVVSGVELATGKLRHSFSITAFATRLLGFNFGWHHASLTYYDGPWGQGGSHSFNMMIVQTGKRTGQIITPDLRIYDISSKDGIEWILPRGFFSKLRLDTKYRRWRMTHFTGLEVEFFQGALKRPGYPMSIRDPNNNTMRLEYDASGLLQHIITDLGQIQTFVYDEVSRLRAFTDHIGRAWFFRYDNQNRLSRIMSPTTEFADIASGQEITGGDLTYVLVNQPRTMKLAYTDERFPSHITAVTDQRGATPDARLYDEQGRVETALINGKPVQYAYDVDIPLDKLEQANTVTRVVDREGNVIDHEIHGLEGGPLRGLGRFGLRRKVTWTEKGKGNPPLRDDEPANWEQRWLHDCKCLSPGVVVQPFSNDDAVGLTFDERGIPTNWPRTVYTYDDNRQVTVELYTDGTKSIRKESAYQEEAYGNGGQYARMIRWTDPRAFDDNPIYAGLGFEHTYQYDERGNRIRHDAPAITRGVDTPQDISEIWDYNAFGQVVRHVDPNGNVTINTYYDGLSSDGDINSKGQFAGYLASTTVGAEGSKDALTNLTTEYRVNPLGMITQETDPIGFVYDTEYNNLQKKTRWIEPPVILRNDRRVRYETRCIYDGAGNKVIERRSNIDLDGSVPANAWIDKSMSYDDVDNLLSERVEVDDNSANDLITRFAYDGNDDLIIIQKPEGNREFRVYDERRLHFKTFYGVASGDRIDDGYPADKRSENLGGTAFVGLTVETYDARHNHIRHRDGRGNDTLKFNDFYNRPIAESDPNGNGWMRQYDDASNVLTTERGAVSPDTGQITQLLERTYDRFDEIGRPYQQVLDINLNSDEGAAVDPDDGRNSSYRMLFDPSSRTTQTADANGNLTSYTYDAANRMLTVTDALGNVRAHTYDANFNIVSLTETEVPGPGAGGAPETYVTTYTYDELNRMIEQHIRGLNGNSIDHVWFFAYDSRSNERLVQDAEGNFTLTTFDDFDRMVVQQRFDGDPFAGTPTELMHYEWAYDRNNRLVEERALAEVRDPGSVQVTRHVYDDLDRCVRTVYPDSDDPIDGGSDGPDGAFDRVEMRYDAINLVGMTDQRGVVYTNTFDLGNRLTGQDITLPPDVPGTTKLAFAYDALDRIVSSGNDFAFIEQVYDPLSRITSETQSLRLDGTGFTRGWEHAIRILHAYDRQSNRRTCSVRDGRSVDLDVGTRYDALNRVEQITARYFRTPRHDIATYAYLGPWRVQTKTLGNGAALMRTYDVKRRVRTHQWTGSLGLLVGFAYNYDRMDNVLFEQFAHDRDRYDHFYYNDRYEVIGVEYRANGATPPANPRTRFFYDDVFNRTQADFGDPFGAQANTVDSYTANRVNEYTQIRRNGQAVRHDHDRVGNLTQLLVQPVTYRSQQPDVLATARWDAINLLFDIDTGVTPQQNYRFDAFRRRIVTLELDGDAIQPGSRRYIYDGWEVVEERLFDDDATLRAAPSTLERIYVNGQEIDEPLLAAIDRNGDGQLGGNVPKNMPAADADQEYYFLNNRLGSVMALLDADRIDRVLEYYRYTVYGEVTVLPVIDLGSDSSKRLTGKAVIPTTLAQPVAAPTSHRQMASTFGNNYMFTGRRFDNQTGLYYYRNRYFQPRIGRFLSRDPIDYVTSDFYSYATNSPVNAKDPLGLQPCPGVVSRAWPLEGLYGSDPVRTCNEVRSAANANLEEIKSYLFRLCRLKPGCVFFENPLITCNPEIDCVLRRGVPMSLRQGVGVEGMFYRCRAWVSFPCVDRKAPECKEWHERAKALHEETVRKETKRRLKEENEHLDRKRFWYDVFEVYTYSVIIFFGGAPARRATPRAKPVSKPQPTPVPEPVPLPARPMPLPRPVPMRTAG